MATRTKRQAAKSKPAAADLQESRRGRFIRIGNARMRRVINSIRLLGNLANPNYDCREADVTAMIETINKATAEMLTKFQKHGRTAPLEFQFAELEDNGGAKH